MRAIISIIAICFVAIYCTSICAEVKLHSVDRYGRSIQLDGFLLDWKKTDAIALSADSGWFWDVINTKEGLTGYFKSVKKLTCKKWNFKFLPRQLSPYHALLFRTDSVAEQSLYRVSHADDPLHDTIVCEWVIPWSSVYRDTAGKYQVGLFVCNECGDSLCPVIITGRYPAVQTESWGNVYLKSMILGMLLIGLFVFQKRVRANFGVKKKKTRTVL